MDIFFVFLFGLILGSFFNVCIYRIPAGESIAYPPSHCTSCNNQLKPIDLVPVLSYLSLKGRCRYCGIKISMRYMLVELFTGVLYVLAYMKYGFTLEFVKIIILISFMIIIGLIDYDTTDVYSVTTWSAIVIGGIFIIVNLIINNNYDYWNYIWGGVIGGGFISVIILLTKGMGWGDAEICLLAGIYLGKINTILMLFIAVVLGGIVGVYLLVIKKNKGKDAIAFGPFLAISTILCALAGERILEFYLRLISY